MTSTVYIPLTFGVYDMLFSDFSATSAPFKNIFILYEVYFPVPPETSADACICGAAVPLFDTCAAATAARVGFLTVTVHEAVLFPSSVFTVITAVPFAFAVTRPELETDATLLLLLDHVTF